MVVPRAGRLALVHSRKVDEGHFICVTALTTEDGMTIYRGVYPGRDANPWGRA